MNTVSEPRLKEIMLYVLKHGDLETVKQYNISPETLSRYKRLYRFDSTKEVKILLFDIETLPMKAYTWKLFKPMLSYTNIIEDWCCLSWSAKWLFDSEMMGDVLTSSEAVKRDDKRIMQSMWSLLDDADIIIGHNAKSFDVKKLNTRFIMNGLKPPLPYQVIDTLEISRKYFSFSSNRLDYLGQLMKNKSKIETNFELWKKCDNGDEESLGYMMKYNHQDVLLLEEVYLELRPWIKSHPNLAVYMETDKESCPSCGSEQLTWKGHYATQSGKYAAFRCDNCGTIGRCRTSTLSKEQRGVLNVSVGR